MRVFVALAFACGALAAAVQPLEAASDLQDAVFDIENAPEVAGLEARHADLGEAEFLDKRNRLSRKTITVIQSANRAVNPPPIYMDGIRLDFIIARRQVKVGNNMVSQWYCKSLRFTNGGTSRRRVIARVHGGPTMMMTILPSRTIKVLAVPKNVSEFIMEVISVPGNLKGPRPVSQASARAARHWLVGQDGLRQRFRGGEV
ncbi:hypothetical protein E4U37_004462 [Claviceps purpurea]|nr:hypothetical protein E4U37_004462 [Claviceps purpurea]